MALCCHQGNRSLTPELVEVVPLCVHIAECRGDEDAGGLYSRGFFWMVHRFILPPAVAGNTPCPPPCHLPLTCTLDELWQSGGSTSPTSEADIAIYRVILVRQLFERLEQNYGTLISGISIPF